MTDAELVVLARAGSEEAFGHLVSRYHRDCLRFARWMLGDPHQAEDAVQETMLRVFQALPRYREQQQFRSWLFQILANRCRSLRYRWKRWALRHASIDDAAQVAAPAERDPEELAAVTQALAALPAALREAFILKHGEGFSYEEMAELTGASVPALKMRVKRARDLMRVQLEDIDARTN
ncbi:MAG: RNA polymerase sigma factor [Gemmatimonadetes bacterium]|nr:RNA polymerase sigma factor [Gemmatimonadota bacterium]